MDPIAQPSCPSPIGRALHQVSLTLHMIRFSHSVFALPFALLAMALAADGWPNAHVIIWIVLACVFARSAAMSFNRILDEKIDRLNPRTKGWPLAAGLLSRRFVWLFCAANIAGFCFSAAMLNPLALALSPVALLVLLGYSTAKRWTDLSHFILGLALGIAPIGAWIGVRGELALTPVVLGMAVVCWVGGFDILYACQDMAFDRRQGLHSLPARLGASRALALAALAHAGAVFLFLMVEFLGELGTFYGLALICAALLLAVEHAIVSPRDLTRLNTAFFTLNGWVSLLLFLGGLADILLRSQ